MEQFTIVNLLDLEDVVSARVEGLEGRFGRAQLDSRDLGVSHWRYAPGLHATTGHRHGEQEEAYIVVAGSGKALLDGEVHELRQWDVVRCAPPVIRAFAAGPEGMDIIAIGGPKPEGRDGEMIEVTWPD
jgi:quercetin dioxygenase-like cupin family protein